ncbi:hypothetical protein F2Q68_00017754 [Brassica cretica]|uniref:(S)-2-hydroxy-acid oxidase n=1 Tax=Brassica cretica TaxID=69181 RepID=A0A8S9HNE2_BRACR|nr:hypothetical protein F2Q68_00017754 [Brassica cretica]
MLLLRFGFWFGFVGLGLDMGPGEYATARAASAAGTIMTLSSWTTSSVEEVASTGPGIRFFQIRFFQLQVYKNRKVVEQLVRRAERAGFKAIVLTADAPRLGRRESDIKNWFTLPPNLALKNFEGLDLGKMGEANDSGLASYVDGQIDRTLSWKDVQWLQTITKMPILVKGVLTGEDARIAIQAGAAGIVVSNHGGRQLDYVPATISALEETVVFDVALALGASGIFIGRPVLFSLAAEGEAGVRKVLQMLRDEFELTMALSGCRSLSEITRNHIVTEWDTPRHLPKKVVEQLVRRAERAGFKAIVLTADAPRLGRRESDIKNWFTLPPNLALKNFEGLDLGKMGEANDSGLASYVDGQIDRTLSWKDVQWLQTITKMPILVKGVLTGEDARIAIQAGAAGIIVSNHGGRQLDYVPATISALEEVVKATQGRVPVFLDGGVRRGTCTWSFRDILLFSLAADGEAGVRKVLQMLPDEFELTMALSGCRSLSEITRNHIVTEWDTPRNLPKL